MIHSPQVVDRIEHLLRLSGITNNDNLEEMIGHYLVEIENQISSGESTQTAIRNTFKNIASTDFSEITPKKSNSKIIISSIFVLGIILIAFFLMKPACKKQNQIAKCNKFDSLPTAWPLANDDLDITSTFGNRYHPVTNRMTLHKGIDIKAKTGTPVLATGKAIVSDSGYNSSTGYYIILKHHSSYSTRYNHLSKIEVKSCQKVNKGDQIGLVGSSGMSFMPHLHYEILKDKVPIDPMDMVAP